MTQDTREAIEAAARAAVAEYTLNHPCRFPDQEAGTLHIIAGMKRDEAEALHQLMQGLPFSRVTMLCRAVKILDSTIDRLASAIVWMLLLMALAALVAISRAKGWLL